MEIDEQGLQQFLQISENQLLHLVAYHFCCGCELVPGQESNEGFMKVAPCELWKALVRKEEAERRLHELTVAHNQAMEDVEKKLKL